ncbi:BrnT family toxin [Glaciimonas sp. PAMC28666]|nr:BrnT family toxin [Glaciimonas sp. PAMC28666]QRX85078.1 BrnT family toxin [Glaciimonas sp. PAMC28666]
MEITFNQTKDSNNEVKHGISLAALLEWDTLYVTADKRHTCSEERMIGYTYIDLRLYLVVFGDRNDVRRIISQRKANEREVKRYATT